MNPRAVQRMAIALSTLAGYVDAVGYLALGGLFVAFMSGNSTVLGIAITEGLGPRIHLAAGLVLAFVLGVVLGTLVGRPFAARRPPVILLLVAALLAAATLLARAGHIAPAGLAIALAMGSENTVFQKDGQAGIGLTYMTGTLVRLGQKFAEACIGGPRTAIMAAIIPDTLLWTGMVVGAGAGALAYERLGFDALLLAVAAALALAAAAQRAQRTPNSFVHER